MAADLSRQWGPPLETLDPLTGSSGAALFPIWTPTGRELVFNSARGGGTNLYQRAADGTGEVKQLAETTETFYPSSISHDG